MSLGLRKLHRAHSSFRAALSEIPEDAKELVIKNDYFRMEFSEREHEGPFGHAYKFTLTDAIDECEEYVVDWEAFTS